ncbi:MAG: hypothetical protein K9G42_02735 [Pedobacter sp.]|nr:hypothetical protein [Pedobacter sp.]
MDNETLNLDNAYQDITNDLKQLDAELKPLYEQDINNSCLPAVHEFFKKSYETFEDTKQTFFKYVAENRQKNYNNKNLRSKLSEITRKMTNEMVHLRHQQMLLFLKGNLEDLLSQTREITGEFHQEIDNLQINVTSTN